MVEEIKTLNAITFQKAQVHFRQWVTDEGIATQLLWLFREDVIFLFDRVFVRKPNQEENEGRMEECYQLGQARGFGLNLHGFCLLDSMLCCYVALPKDDAEAQSMLMGPHVVKYSWRSDLLHAERVSNPLVWRARSWKSQRARFTHFDSHLPSKHTLLPNYTEARG
jgi:hypothetical protein